MSIDSNHELEEARFAIKILSETFLEGLSSKEAEERGIQLALAIVKETGRSEDTVRVAWEIAKATGHEKTFKEIYEERER